MTISVTISPANESVGISGSTIWTAHILESDSSQGPISVSKVEVSINGGSFTTVYTGGSYQAGYTGAGSALTGSGESMTFAIQPNSAFSNGTLVQYRLTTVTAGVDSAPAGPYSFLVGPTQVTRLACLPKSRRSR